jgi:hypothetical protein
VTLQLQVADDLGPEETVDVGGGGDLVAGPHFLGDAGATQHLAALQYQHLEALSGQIGGGHEAVVASTDDYEIVLDGHE